MDQGSGCIESHGPANQAKYQSGVFKFLKETVATLVEALEQGKAEKIIEQVEVASKLLEGLSVDIYTPSLRQLKEASQDLQAVAKSSGAGGGTVVLP